MIFWLCLILGVGLFIGGIKLRDISYDVETFGFLITILGGLLLVIFLTMSFWIIGEHVEADATKARLEQTYESLVYKCENGACKDELGLLNKEFIDEIQKWNEDIAYNKAVQRNFWTGIFVPNIYDDFQTIDYAKYYGGK